MQVLTTTTVSLLGVFRPIESARWWLWGCEDGMRKAIENMRRTREWSNDDAFWRRVAHQKLRLARRELRQARDELQVMMADRDLEYQTRNDSRLMVGE